MTTPTLNLSTTENDYYISMLYLGDATLLQWSQQDISSLQNNRMKPKNKNEI